MARPRRGSSATRPEEQLPPFPAQQMFVLGKYIPPLGTILY